MATRQTTMIKASITAYSTAVGPSSAFQKSTTYYAARLGWVSTHVGRATDW
jgi:hypothetical protein